MQSCWVEVACSVVDTLEDLPVECSSRFKANISRFISFKDYPLRVNCSLSDRVYGRRVLLNVLLELRYALSGVIMRMTSIVSEKPRKPYPNQSTPYNRIILIACVKAISASLYYLSLPRRRKLAPANAVLHTDS